MRTILILLALILANAPSKADDTVSTKDEKAILEMLAVRLLAHQQGDAAYVNAVTLHSGEEAYFVKGKNPPFVEGEKKLHRVIRKTKSGYEVIEGAGIQDISKPHMDRRIGYEQKKVIYKAFVLDLLKGPEPVASIKKVGIANDPNMIGYVVEGKRHPFHIYGKPVWWLVVKGGNDFRVIADIGAVSNVKISPSSDDITPALEYHQIENLDKRGQNYAVRRMLYNKKTSMYEWQ